MSSLAHEPRMSPVTLGDFMSVVESHLSTFNSPGVRRAVSPRVQQQVTAEALRRDG